MLNGFLISGLTSFLRHIQRRHPTRVATRQELIRHILTILNENLARPSVVSHRIIIGTTDTESSTPSSLKRHAAFQIVRGHVKRITRPWLSPPQSMSSLPCVHLQTSTPVIRFWASIFQCTRRQILLAAARTATTIWYTQMVRNSDMPTGFTLNLTDVPFRSAASSLKSSTILLLLLFRQFLAPNRAQLSVKQFVQGLVRRFLLRL